MTLDLPTRQKLGRAACLVAGVSAWVGAGVQTWFLTRPPLDIGLFTTIPDGPLAPLELFLRKLLYAYLILGIFFLVAAWYAHRIVLFFQHRKHHIATAQTGPASMKIVNTDRIPELTWSSPKGKFVGAGKEISEELGRQPDSTDLHERHPFDVEICRIPSGKTPYPYHSHSAQWEFYHVLAGQGLVRHQDGTTRVGPGDAFLFKPNEPHQLINDGDVDLVLYVVADNPLGEHCHYPDSNKWSVSIPERKLLRSEPLDYYDGEE